MADKKQTQAKQSTEREPASKSSQDEPKSKSTEKTSEAISTGGADLSTKISSLVELFKSNLDDIVPSAAMSTIEDWQGVLQKAKEPELKEIASGLKELQKLIKKNGEEVSKHDLGELLSQLGEQTSEVAVDADKGMKAPLKQLGSQLTKIGRSLGKAEDRQQLESVDELVEMLDTEAPHSDPKAAIAEIDRWYEVLNKCEAESLKAIASELKELKQLLKASKSKGDDISEKLMRIGELTTEAASDAGRGCKGAVQKLGKALTKFAKQSAVST